MRNRILIFVGMMVLLVATTAGASNFRGADLIYLNGAINAAGGGGTFKSQVIITNLSSVSVDVDAAFLPTRADTNNSGFTTTSVGTLAPGAQAVYDDFVGDVLGLPISGNPFGHMLFFSCRTGGDCSDCVTNPADCAPIAVESRVYSFQGSASNGTSGQLFPGYPWYSYVSRDVADRGLDKVRILGIRVNSAFRSNLGLVNSSQFSSTTLRVSLFRNDGTLFGTPFNQVLAPLAHTQVPVTNLFAGFSGDGYVLVEQIAVNPTNPSDPDCGDGCPGFFAYGSVLDNITNDATTLEAIYLVEFDFEQVYGAKPTVMPKRPVRHPSHRNW